MVPIVTPRKSRGSAKMGAITRENHQLREPTKQETRTDNRTGSAQLFDQRRPVRLAVWLERHVSGCLGRLVQGRFLNERSARQSIAGHSIGLSEALKNRPVQGSGAECPRPRGARQRRRLQGTRRLARAVRDRADAQALRIFAASSAPIPFSEPGRPESRARPGSSKWVGILRSMHPSASSAALSGSGFADVIYAADEQGLRPPRRGPDIAAVYLASPRLFLKSADSRQLSSRSVPRQRRHPEGNRDRGLPSLSGLDARLRPEVVTVYRLEPPPGPADVPRRATSWNFRSASADGDPPSAHSVRALALRDRARHLAGRPRPTPPGTSAVRSFPRGKRGCWLNRRAPRASLADGARRKSTANRARFPRGDARLVLVMNGRSAGPTLGSRSKTGEPLPLVTRPGLTRPGKMRSSVRPLGTCGSGQGL